MTSLEKTSTLYGNELEVESIQEWVKVRRLEEGLELGSLYKFGLFKIVQSWKKAFNVAHNEQVHRQK